MTWTQRLRAWRAKRRREQMRVKVSPDAAIVPNRTFFVARWTKVHGAAYRDIYRG